MPPTPGKEIRTKSPLFFIKENVKKLSHKQRARDVLRSLVLRTQSRKTRKSVLKHFVDSAAPVDSKSRPSRRVRAPNIKAWIKKARENGLNVLINRKNMVTLILPERMNFSTHFEPTMLYMSAIRKLANSATTGRKAYRLASVMFENLKYISSSAALVLTAEISRWDDQCNVKLKQIGQWDPDIQNRFIELGFFDLFENNPFQDSTQVSSSHIRHVRYIKSSCGDPAHKGLKTSLEKIVGEQIEKFTFLRSGLDEAITNVVQHAYPNPADVDGDDVSPKFWYLTGGYNTQTKDLKISFYDQGIGIPKSLPESNIKENILKLVSIFPLLDQKKDEVLLKAAMQFRRSSTRDHDRGNGLGDLLEFIKQKNDGYLSVLSRHGLYKFSIENGVEKEKSERLASPVEGTLIIWKTNLR